MKDGKVNIYLSFQHALSVKKLKMLAERTDDGAVQSPGNEYVGPYYSKSDNMDKIENFDDSDSENGEFITIKVTNEEGKIETEEVDHIKEHRAR